MDTVLARIQAPIAKANLLFADPLTRKTNELRKKLVKTSRRQQMTIEDMIVSHQGIVLLTEFLSWVAERYPQDSLVTAIASFCEDIQANNLFLHHEYINVFVKELRDVKLCHKKDAWKELRVLVNAEDPEVIRGFLIGRQERKFYKTLFMEQDNFDERLLSSNSNNCVEFVASRCAKWPQVIDGNIQNLYDTTHGVWSGWQNKSGVKSLASIITAIVDVATKTHSASLHKDRGIIVRCGKRSSAKIGIRNDSKYYVTIPIEVLVSTCQTEAFMFAKQKANFIWTAHPSRQFIDLLTVSGNDVRLWMFARNGTFMSRIFDLNKEWKTFISVILGVFTTGLERLGVDTNRIVLTRQKRNPENTETLTVMERIQKAEGIEVCGRTQWVFSELLRCVSLTQDMSRKPGFNRLTLYAQEIQYAVNGTLLGGTNRYLEPPRQSDRITDMDDLRIEPRKEVLDRDEANRDDEVSRGDDTTKQVEGSSRAISVVPRDTRILSRGSWGKPANILGLP
jgi:hypothetical protein